jgi:tRNA(Arg) A34 adenosine deaminase TadA
MLHDDKYFLKIAIEEGKKGNAPYLFGAIVVKNGEIIAKDHNHVAERTDPTAHAENSALVLAAKKLGNQNLPGCTLYASHEPCMMCFSCAAWAEIDRIVFSTPASEQDSFMYEFKDVNIFDMAKILTRPMQVECIEL